MKNKLRYFYIISTQKYFLKKDRMILYCLKLKCCKVTWVNFTIFQKYLSLSNCAMHPVVPDSVCWIGLIDPMLKTWGFHGITLGLVSNDVCWALSMSSKAVWDWDILVC